MIADSILLNLFRLAAAGALWVFVMSKSPYSYTMKTLCKASMDYGDLYREAKVRDFRPVRLPPEVGPRLENTPAELADAHRVFVLGDSFMADRRGHPALPLMLGARLREPVYFGGWAAPSPVCMMEEALAGKPRRPRVLIMESVERSLVERFETPAACPGREGPGRDPLFPFVAQVWERWLGETDKRQRFLLYNSDATAPYIEAVNTALYRWFGRMPAQTPAYTVNPPRLFSRQEAEPSLLSSFYRPHPEDAVARMADTVASQAAQLRHRFDATLVFMPVPNAMSLYHDPKVHGAYDGFLSRLCDVVEKRGVKVIRLWEPFKSAPEPVYYPADTHWNATGVELALERAVKAARR